VKATKTATEQTEIEWHRLSLSTWALAYCPTILLIDGGVRLAQAWRARRW
jgi:hypothetical protein